MRRPWFADNHDKIGKLTFITISKEGDVFATDSFFKTVFSADSVKYLVS